MGCVEIWTPEGRMWKCEESGVVYWTYDECIAKCGAEPEYKLTLGVDKYSGKLGDVFTFMGTLYKVGGSGISGVAVVLYIGNNAVGHALTNSVGTYTIKWTADTTGSLIFHAEANYHARIVSKSLTINVGELPPPPPPPECTVDADCPEGYICVNGKCVPKPPPPSPKKWWEEIEPWQWAVIGVSVFIGGVVGYKAIKGGGKS